MKRGATRTLLLVDDEPAQVRLVTAIAARAGWCTLTVPDGRRAIALIAEGDAPVDAVLIDVWRPAESGAALVREMRGRWPSLPIVMVTAQASVGLAVEAMRGGASDFLVKPIAPERLMAALAGAAFPAEDAGELRPLSEKASEALPFDQIVGSAPAFRAALAVAAKAARSRGPLTIEGEAGTGRELIARAVHAASSRGRRRPVMIHCGALPAGMAAAELAGFERGAFPGAFQHHPGRIAAADGSTLILAGIEALDAAAQQVLLNLIERGETAPMGGGGVRGVDVRVIAVTTRPLTEQAAQGSFDPLLAERLGAIAIRVPPLRERHEDIPALARHLLARIGERPGMARPSLSDAALALLGGHFWPGNVRQLHDTLFRAAVDSQSALLTPEDFPQVSRAALCLADRAETRPTRAAGVQLYERDGHLRALEAIEADIIRLAIGHYNGRMSEVARRLGIGRSTLYRKLEELGLDTAA